MECSKTISYVRASDQCLEHQVRSGLLADFLPQIVLGCQIGSQTVRRFVSASNCAR